MSREGVSSNLSNMEKKSEDRNGVTPFLQMRGVSKSYSGVRVLHHVNLSVDTGEVLALVDRLPALVQQTMDQFAGLTGRQYRLFDYFGDPRAERVLVLMGSGVETARETADYLIGLGEKVGVLSVRLYRPFSIKDFVAALPATTRALAVLDRVDQDVATAVHYDAVA